MSSVGNPAKPLIQNGQFTWVTAKPAPPVRWQAVMKRSFDVVATAILIPLLLPILALIALIVRMDSRGPALFLDRRLGRNGCLFTCYKFRTMHVESDRILRDYLNQNPQALVEWRRFRKLRGEDPRVTRVGRLLRRLSLDELPQVFNVLRGDMSLVGPRPYLARERELMGSSRDDILRVRPGITGLWQVAGRNEIAFEDRLKLEAWYARHWSLRLDLAILLRTVFVVFARRGAY